MRGENLLIETETESLDDSRYWVKSADSCAAYEKGIEHGGAVKYHDMDE